MSQIETIMLVVLGLVVLLLGILLLGRGLWSVRSGNKPRRIGKSAPKTVTEIQAERDRLRAEYAVMSRKQEIQISSLKTKLTEQMSEVSRSKNKIDQLSSELEVRNQVVGERESELAEFRGVVSPLETELASSTNSVQRLKEEVRQKTIELERLVTENANLKQREAKKDLAISKLEQRIATSSAASPINRLSAKARQDIEQAEDVLDLSLRQKGPAEKPKITKTKPKRITRIRKSIAENEKASTKSTPPKRSKRRKVLSLAKRIRTIQEEAEG